MYAMETFQLFAANKAADYNHSTATANNSSSTNTTTTHTSNDDHNDDGGGSHDDEGRGEVDKLAKTGYLVALALAIIIGNVLVIVSVVKVKDMHRVTNYFLVSLAAADLMVGVFTIPLFIVWLLKQDVFVHSNLCNAVLLSCLFVTVASQFNVIVVTVERYVAVCHPFLHRRVLANRPEIVRTTIFLVWFFSVLFSALSTFAIDRNNSRCSYYAYFQPEFLLASVIVGVFVPFAIIFCLNVQMLVKVRSSFLFKQDMYQPASSRRGSMQAVLSKATKMVVIVCCLFLLFWTPFFIVIVIHTFCPDCSLHQTLDLVLLFAFTSSACNPAVYALCNLMFRRAYTQVLTSGCCTAAYCCCCCRGTSREVGYKVTSRRDSVFVQLSAKLSVSNRSSI